MDFQKKNWQFRDLITEGELNRMEDGIEEGITKAEQAEQTANEAKDTADAVQSDLSVHVSATTGVHGATSAATPNTLVQRDPAGRFKAAAPAAADDVARKDTVDGAISSHVEAADPHPQYFLKSGGTMAGSIVMPNNTPIFGQFTDGITQRTLLVMAPGNNVQIGNIFTHLTLASGPSKYEFFNGDSNDLVTFTIGEGSPEGNVTARPGSWYVSRSGGAGTTFWVKESGTGNTGWVATGQFVPIETGAWTPELRFGGSTTGITYVYRAGRYTRIANVVYWAFAIELSSKGSASGTATIAGLPFNIGAGLNLTFYHTVGRTINISVPSGQWLSSYIVSTNVHLITNTGSLISNTEFSNNSVIGASGFYFI